MEECYRVSVPSFITLHLSLSTSPGFWPRTKPHPPHRLVQHQRVAHVSGHEAKRMMTRGAAKMKRKSFRFSVFGFRFSVSRDAERSASPSQNRAGPRALCFVFRVGFPTPRSGGSAADRGAVIDIASNISPRRKRLPIAGPSGTGRVELCSVIHIDPCTTDGPDVAHPVRDGPALNTVDNSELTLRRRCRR